MISDDSDRLSRSDRELSDDLSHLSSTHRLNQYDSGDESKQNPSKAEYIDSLLDFLQTENPSFSAQSIADRVFRHESSQRHRKSLLFRCFAISASLLLTLAGWRAGSHKETSSSLGLGTPAGIEQFQGLFLLPLDDPFIDAMFRTDLSSEWDKKTSSDPVDILKLAEARMSLSPDSAEAIQKAALANYLSLPDSDREKWKKLARRMASLPQSERSIVQNRLLGMRITLASLPDRDRRRLEAMPGLDRWAFLNQRAENQRRFMEQGKRAAFSVSEFNRPDYLMDLAQVTRAWNELTPAQKRALERRAMTSKVDPARKIERLRILAQSLDADGMGTVVTKPGQMRGGPLQRALAKAETFKQEREKRRSDFQKIVAGTIPPASNPADLERTLESSPPWLVESIDPLPPDEARRFLSLLNFLIENHDAADEQVGNGH